MASRGSLPTPDVSVVMPVGSIDDHLPSALSHIAAQETNLSWELVISLNTPATEARQELDLLLDRHALPARVIDASSVRSAAFARNTGAQAAKADKLLFCDGDDEAEPDWLDTLATSLEPLTALGGHLAEERLVIPGQETWRPPATPGQLPSFMGSDYLVSANMACWKADFQAVGGFSESLLRGEDIDFGWKLLGLGVELRYVADAVMHYRHRAGLRALLEQHYLYGRGMAQVLAHRTPPGAERAPSMLKANGQKPDSRSTVHYLRRGAIGVGRVRGLLDARSIDRVA